MQTTVEMNTKRARAGLIAYAFNATDVRTMAAEGAVPFGHVVVEGTSTRQGKLPATSGDVVAGICALTQAIESRVGTAAESYPDEKDINVVNFGSVWAVCTDTNLPTVNGSVYAVVGTAAAGKLTSSSSGNINLTTKLVVREVDTVNKLALVEFREKV
jgi:hypothetical protein